MVCLGSLAQDKHKEVRTAAQEAMAAVHSHLDASAVQEQAPAVQAAVLRILQVPVHQVALTRPPL